MSAVPNPPVGTLMASLMGVSAPPGWAWCVPGASVPAADHPVLDTVLPWAREPRRRWWQIRRRWSRPYGGTPDTIGLPDLSPEPFIIRVS